MRHYYNQVPVDRRMQDRLMRRVSVQFDTQRFEGTVIKVTPPPPGAFNFGISGFVYRVPYDAGEVKDGELTGGGVKAGTVRGAGS